MMKGVVGRCEAFLPPFRLGRVETDVGDRGGTELRRPQPVESASPKKVLPTGNDMTRVVGRAQ